ncbi:hypothetical protein [Embleya hyalina]|uniref:Sporulation protein SsgA n=1 Tax=Embleya hyalina TaxID=516124 RepID=A0A401YR89_9ACTN|nr:hypothetical protein [Embleya hyalina]GCD97120.1 sporulation protein SsgA [Embleya hyalina]
MARKSRRSRATAVATAPLDQAAKHLTSRAAPLLPPWMVAAGLTIPAALAHDTIGTNPAATALIGAAGAGITVAAWSEASKRSPRLRAMATVSTGAASAYLTAATVAGPTSPNVALLQALGGGTLALWWNLRHALRNSGAESVSDGLFEMVGLARTQVVKGEVVAGEVSAELQLPRGEMVPDDVQNRIPQMASALGTSPAAIRVTPNRDDHSRVTLSVTPVDHLRKSVLYPGPSLPGQSIARPIRLGIYQDAQPLEFWLPGTEDRDHPRPLSHLLTTGMSGSGKSGSLKVLLTEAMTRSDAVVWFADPSKGSQSIGAIQGGLDWCETTPQGVSAMLDVLPIVVKTRADLLGRLGYAQWEPECWTKHGIPLLLIHFEESADDAVADHPNVVPVAQQARSTGTVLSFSLQRASFTGISTEVRAQFGTSLIFGVKDDGDAFTLDGAAKDAGASPEQWAAERPGMLYLQAPGVDRERWPVPARAFRLPEDEQVRSLIAAYDAVRPKGVDATTAKAAGPRYAAYKTRAIRRACGEEEATGPGPLRTALAERPRVPASLEEAEIVESEPIDGETEFEPTRRPYESDHESDLDAQADPDAELEEPSRVVQVGEPEFRVKRPADQARAEMLTILEELRAEDRAVCAPRDFPEARVGRSRSWVSRRLAEFADGGREVAENPGGQLGSWLIIPRDDAFEDYAA